MCGNSNIQTCTFAHTYVCAVRLAAELCSEFNATSLDLNCLAGERWEAAVTGSHGTECGIGCGICHNFVIFCMLRCCCERVCEGV